MNGEVDKNEEVEEEFSEISVLRDKTLSTKNTKEVAIYCNLSFPPSLILLQWHA